jgi:hypothetical protein
MKRNLLWLLLVSVVVLGIAAAIDNSTQNLYIQNSDPTVVKIRVRTGAAQTAPWLEFVETNATRFSLPATGLVPLEYGGTAAATAKGARTSLGLPEATTNGTPLIWRQYLQLVEAQVTNTVLPVASGGTGAGSVAAVKLAFGIQSGTAIISDDGLVTNDFTEFATAPVVVVTGQSPSATNAVITSITTTNFIVNGLTNDLIQWIAIGLP